VAARLANGLHPDAVLYHKVGMSGDEYQHLIRGVAPGQVPKFWFRRRSPTTRICCASASSAAGARRARLAAALIAAPRGT